MSNHFTYKYVQVMFSMSKHYAVMTCSSSASKTPCILDLRWVVSFTPREKALGTHWMGDWVLESVYMWWQREKSYSCCE